jgi:hypothetical protein
MTPVTRVLCATGLLLLVPACGGGVQPLGPTPVDQGIVVFMHSGFRGTSQQLGADVADLTLAEGPCNIGEDDPTGSWNDCISSVRVLPGYYARLYGDKNFRGAVLEITGDVSDLKAVDGHCSGSFDDCISSIRVVRLQ